MSREEFKGNIYNLRYWFGHAATVVLLGTILWRMAVNQTNIEAKLQNLEGIPARVGKVEAKQDGYELRLTFYDARIGHLESYAGDEMRWRQAPTK